MIIGIDEVGRGCWAGPLVAAAVMLDDDFEVPDEADWVLKDSKQLSRVQREVAAEYINNMASVGVGWVEASEIDEIGLTEANRRAMLVAVRQLDYRLAGEIIIDGNIDYLGSYVCDGDCAEEPCEQCYKIKTVVGADGKIIAVSAASVIAKVARDNFMANQAVVYPEYGFEKHVGYGTKFHLEQLQKFGLTPLHRRSYKPIKALL